MLEGFRKFITRGNVVDLAVGVVVGTAFGAVVDSLVKDVLMAIIATLVGKPDFSDVLVFGAVRLGAFITAIINFLLIAAAVYFFVVVPINRMNEMSKKTEPPPAPPEPSAEEKLLTEIRDLLQQNITRS
ncbi:MAG: large conductance mechanosensitive channel protein MscL [Roseiflexaceae bacterium]|nr:large conductance mechanosensitive channel protein MscL [Roseiflexus sp.]MDW8214399.1 large conductance mechanosensitive channel protein MscL [Roseiflexaceae bacterium]